MDAVTHTSDSIKLLAARIDIVLAGEGGAYLEYDHVKLFREAEKCLSQLATVTRQRDDLLEAAEQLEAEWFHVRIGERQHDVYEMLCTVIANVKEDK